MKEKLSLEGRNPQAMPLSKVIKNLPSANIDIQPFALKDIVVEAKAAAAEETRLAKEAYEKGVLLGAKEGYQKGFSEGEALGKKMKQEELSEYNKTVQLLQSVASGLSHFAEQLLVEAEKDVLKISMSVAERIVRKEILENPDILLAYVHEGLKGLGHAETAVIRIHPQDLELLTKKSPDILQAIAGVEHLQFEQDLSLLPGDCIVETKERSVDGRVSSQLSIIARALLPQPTGKDQ